MFEVSRPYCLRCNDTKLNCFICNDTGMKWDSTGWIPIGPCNCLAGKKVKQNMKEGKTIKNIQHRCNSGKQKNEIQSTPLFEKIKMRTFDTGATRDSDDDKLDFEGFLSPLVIRRYAEYLQKHRIQVDGNKRDSDNWQKGIPLSTYMKSMWRHFVDLWTFHRTKETFVTCDMEEALCAVIFNASGYLHELLKNTDFPEVDPIPHVNILKDLKTR